MEGRVEGAWDISQLVLPALGWLPLVVNDVEN